MEDRRDVGARWHLYASAACAWPRWLALALISAMLSGCQIYSADPISGRVVEKGTGQPIEGAVVVAAWIPTGGLEGNNPQGLVEILESVTDAQGKYTIPGWGPKPHFGLSVIGVNSPQLLVFKYGYDLEIRGEGNYWKSAAPSHMTSEQNGKAIELARASSSMREYANRLTSIDVRVLDQLVEVGGCVWKRTPYLIKAVDDAHIKLKAAGVSPLAFRSMRDLELKSSCGSVRSFVEENAR